MLFDSTAEETIITGLLKHASNAIIAIEGFDLRPQDFQSQQNGLAYHLIKTYIDELSATSVDLSIIQYRAKMNNTGIDPDYLETLYNKSVSIQDLPEYAKTVKICSLIRRCVARTAQLLNDERQFNPTTPYNVVWKTIDSAYQDFVDILLNTNNSTFKHIYTTVGDTLNQIIAGKKKVGLICKKFPKWMQMLGGSFRRGSLNVISGFAKGGKSALSLSVAEDIASQGYPTLYIDTELSSDYQAERLLATKTGVPLKRIEYGTFVNNPEEEKKLKKELEANRIKFPLYHWDASSLLLDDMMMAMKRWVITQVGKDENGTKDCLIVFDYLKIASHKEYKASLAEHQLIGIICTNLHDLARKYDIPIVLAAQLNREGQIGASLRIDQLCSTRTSVAKKTPEEHFLYGDTGNRKLSVNLSRFCDFDPNNILHIDMSPENGIWKEVDFHHNILQKLPIEKKNLLEAKKPKKKEFANENN